MLSTFISEKVTDKEKTQTMRREEREGTGVEEEEAGLYNKGERGKSREVWLRDVLGGPAEAELCC